MLWEQEVAGSNPATPTIEKSWTKSGIFHFWRLKLVCSRMKMKKTGERSEQGLFC